MQKSLRKFCCCLTPFESFNYLFCIAYCRNSWQACDPKIFNLRTGPNYKSNQLKAPSPESLMECVGLEYVQLLCACHFLIDFIANVGVAV